MSSQPRLWSVDVLLTLFGISSWLAVNGVWVELPLLVRDLPEAWTLPSHLSVVVQLANIGPLFYSLLRYYVASDSAGLRQQRRLKRLETCTISLMLTVAAIGCLLSALFWRRTVYVAGEERSVALLSLVFFIALVDCTSSVVYIPFTARFSSTYLLSYMVGEGLSGLLPSIAALVQGAGGNARCVNVTSLSDTAGNSTWKLVPAAATPLFSVSTYFCLMMAMTLVSTAAFLGLVRWPLLDSAREADCSIPSVGDTVVTREGSSSGVGSFSPLSETSSFQPSPSTVVSSAILTSTPACTTSDLSTTTNMAADHTISKRTYKQLLAAQALLCVLSNGGLPGLQSYSVLPYGNVAFHLVASLSLMANPAACLLLVVLPCRRCAVVMRATVFTCLMAAGLVYVAVCSPHPPLQHSSIGIALVVIGWVIFVGVATYAKVAIAGLVRPHGHRSLFWYGAWTQVGSLAGAVAAYLSVNVFDVFTSFTPC